MLLQEKISNSWHVGLLRKLSFATEMSLLLQLERNQMHVHSEYDQRSHLLEKQKGERDKKPRNENITPDSGGFQKHIQKSPRDLISYFFNKEENT